MPFYVMVYGVKDMLELTVTQHKTYTKGITYIFIKITNTQESPPSIIIHYVLHYLIR